MSVIVVLEGGVRGAANILRLNQQKSGPSTDFFLISAASIKLRVGRDAGCWDWSLWSDGESATSERAWLACRRSSRHVIDVSINRRILTPPSRSPVVSSCRSRVALVMRHRLQPFYFIQLRAHGRRKREKHAAIHSTVSVPGPPANSLILHQAARLISRTATDVDSTAAHSMCSSLAARRPNWLE